jgi:hypothetical protein
MGYEIHLPHAVMNARDELIRSCVTRELPFLVESQYLFALLLAEIAPPLVYQDLMAFTEFKSCLDEQQCEQVLRFDQEGEFPCDTAPYKFVACVHYCMGQVNFVSHFLERIVDPGSDLRCRNNKSFVFSRHPYRCETTVCKKFNGVVNEKVATTVSNNTNKDLIGANEPWISSSSDIIALVEMEIIAILLLLIMLKFNVNIFHTGTRKKQPSECV